MTLIEKHGGFKILSESESELRSADTTSRDINPCYNMEFNLLGVDGISVDTKFGLNIYL